MQHARQFAVQTAQEAGNSLLKGKKKLHSLQWKDKVDFKTEMDDKCDKLIRRKIHTAFPEHNILSEEEKPRQQGSAYTWVVDPLDGTLNYTTGATDYWAVSIALVHQKLPVLGVIYAPARNELYVAELGKGATCNNKPMWSMAPSTIHQATVAMDYGHGKRAANASIVETLMRPSGVTYLYCFGCVTVSLCQVAKGALHAYAAMDLGPWDMAAGVVINREVGNRVTNLKGEEWNLGERSILAAPPKLHGQLSRLLAVRKGS